MAIFFRKIKGFSSTKAVGSIVLAALFAVYLSTPYAAALGPEFNIFPIVYQDGIQNTDLSLLDGKNFSKGEVFSTSLYDHNAGIQADPGDIIRLQVYYHNGVADDPQNTALNTIIKAFASPSLGTAALTHTISAQISADNASTVTSFGKGGDISIYIQGGIAQSLSLVSGSTKLYRDRGTVVESLPDSIFTSGVNIGDIRGCFDFSGFVNFDLEVSQTLAGDLQIKKEVRNYTNFGAYNDAEVTAIPGDIVEYRITVSALTNQVTNVSLRDALDTRFVSVGTVTVDGVSVSNYDFFSSAGVSLGTVNTSASQIAIFQATVPAKSTFLVGTTILTNTATAFTSSKSVSDNADVRVTIVAQQIVCTYTWDSPLVTDGTLRGLRKVGEAANVREQISGLVANSSFNLVNQHSSGSPTFRNVVTADSQGNYDIKDTTIIPTGYITGDYISFIEVASVNVATCKGFKIEAATVQQLGTDKQVQNDTTGLVYADQVDASPANLVTFRIEIKPLASNTSLTNVTLKDILPTKLTYVSGTFNFNGVFMSEGNLFTSSGVNLGTVSSQASVFATFQADVASAANFTTTCENLVNSATVTATGNLSASDTATVRVCKTSPVKQAGSPAIRPN